MHRTDHDFTTGSIPRHLIAFSWPLFAGNLLQAFYNVVDSIWVGHFVGANGLGAVSVSFPVIFALIALVVGLTMATTTLVAQFKGAGRHDMVRKVNGNSVLLLVYLGTLTTVVGLSVSGPLLRLINTPADIFPMAHQYLTVFLLGLPLMFIYNAVSAVVAFLLPWIARQIGRKRTHAISLLIGGLGLLSIYIMPDENWLILSMVMVGISWASILSMPYAILAGSITPQKMGVYMGIFNFFIVLPQIINAIIGGPLVKYVYDGNPIYALLSSGVSFIIAALLVSKVKDSVR